MAAIRRDGVPSVAVSVVAVGDGVDPARRSTDDRKPSTDEDASLDGESVGGTAPVGGGGGG